MKRLPGKPEFVKPCCDKCSHLRKPVHKKKGKRFRSYICIIYKKMVPYSGTSYPLWCKDKFTEAVK